MPAALDVDWSAVRTLAVAVGIREAARQLGISEDAVMQRSAREGWLSDPQIRAVTTRSVAERGSALSAAVSTPAQAMAASMRSDALRGRAAALRVSRRALERVDRCADDELIEPAIAEVANKWVKSAATAGGYGASDTVARVDLRITGAHEVSAEQPTAYEADWSDAEQRAGVEPTV